MVNGCRRQWSKIRREVKKQRKNQLKIKNKIWTNYEYFMVGGVIPGLVYNVSTIFRLASYGSVKAICLKGLIFFGVGRERRAEGERRRREHGEAIQAIYHVFKM